MRARAPAQRGRGIAALHSVGEDFSLILRADGPDPAVVSIDVRRRAANDWLRAASASLELAVERKAIVEICRDLIGELTRDP